MLRTHKSQISKTRSAADNMYFDFSLKHNLFLEKQQTKEMWTSDVQKLNYAHILFVIDLIFTLFFSC